MKFVTKAAIGMLISLAAAQAHGADVTLSCTDAKVKNGPVILTYTIANTKSARLTSNITYQSQVYSAALVAQYASNALETYFVIDDAATNTIPVLQFAGIPLIKSNFAGVITEYDSTGKAIKNTLAKCKLQ